jgi:hypothetical protein
MKNPMPWLFVAATLLAGACASSPERTTERDCTLSSADSVYLADGPVYRACAVDRPARVVQARVGFTPSITPPSSMCFNAEVEFVTGRDGRPEHGTVRLLRTSHQPFADAVVASVPGWTYSPALLDGVPVRQIVRERRVAAVVAVVTSSSGGPPARPTSPPRGANCR